MYVKSITRKKRQAINKFKNKIAFDMLNKHNMNNPLVLEYKGKKKNYEQKH
jgi:hypothetical protein